MQCNNARPHFLNSMMSSRSSCHRIAHPCKDAILQQWRAAPCSRSRLQARSLCTLHQSNGTSSMQRVPILLHLHHPQTISDASSHEVHNFNQKSIATTLSLQHPPSSPHLQPKAWIATTHSLSTHPQFQPKPQFATLNSLSNHRVLNFNPSPLQPNFLATHVRCSIPTKALCKKLLFQSIHSSISNKAQVSNILSLSLSLSLSSLVVYGVGTLGYCSTESHYHL